MDEFLKDECRNKLAIITFQGKTFLGIPNGNKIEAAREVKGKKIEQEEMREWCKDYNVSLTTDIETVGEVSGYIVKKLNLRQKAWLNEIIDRMVYVHINCMGYLENDVFDKLNEEEEEE